MSAYVFLGPTVALEDARSVCDAVYLPPVRQGDVRRVAAFCEPSAIAVIDGYFEHVPSVWHKEILWALSEGIPVFGAASMGALRAAELAPFGMVGVGRIYTAYRDGVLPPYTEEPFEDDDEVAVVHGPADSGYVSTEAMVNIRCTLATAAEQGVIGAGTRDGLVRIAKGLFYKERTYANLFNRAAGEHNRVGELDALRAWLPAGRIDQKRADALALLAHLRDAEMAAPDVRFRFEHTTMWDQVLGDAGADASGSLILTELRLAGDRYLEARAQALEYLIGAVAMDQPAPAVAIPSDDPQTAARRIREQARHRTSRVQAELLAEPLVDAVILDRMRADGAFAGLLARATAKKNRLAALGLDRPELGDADVAPEDLLAWFTARTGQSCGTDVTVCARRLGFETTMAFYRALVGEYLYVTAEGAG